MKSGIYETKNGQYQVEIHQNKNELTLRASELVEDKEMNKYEYYNIFHESFSLKMEYPMEPGFYMSLSGKWAIDLKDVCNGLYHVVVLSKADMGWEPEFADRITFDQVKQILTNDRYKDD